MLKDVQVYKVPHKPMAIGPPGVPTASKDPKPVLLPAIHKCRLQGCPPPPPSPLPRPPAPPPGASDLRVKLKC